MKFFILLVGAILSIWVGMTVYKPVDVFITNTQAIYLSGKANLAKTNDGIDVIAEKTEEYARLFGSEIAAEKIREFIVARNTPGQKNTIEKIFDMKIALWIAVASGLFTLSIYFNIIAIFRFFLKPVTFFMKK